MPNQQEESLFSGGGIMSTNKKYYYLKLKDNFFETDEIIVLESMQDGYKYSNILLKLYLKSVKNEGRLMFSERIPYNSQMLASVTRHSVGDVEKAIKIFRDLGLIELLDNGAIYMNDIQNFIGHGSSEADRIRAYRGRVEDEKKQIEGVQMYALCTPEIEIELEKELKIEKEKEKEEKTKKEFAVQSTLLSGFELFWANYPKKEGKGQAEKAWRVASKQKDFPPTKQIIQALEAYKKNPTVTKGFIKNPATWINGKCWLDEQAKQVDCWAEEQYA